MTRLQWQHAINKWAGSGLTQAEFCRREKLNLKTFYNKKRDYIGPHIFAGVTKKKTKTSKPSNPKPQKSKLVPVINTLTASTPKPINQLPNAKPEPSFNAKLAAEIIFHLCT